MGYGKVAPAPLIKSASAQTGATLAIRLKVIKRRKNFFIGSPLLICPWQPSPHPFPLPEGEGGAERRVRQLELHNHIQLEAVDVAEAVVRGAERRRTADLRVQFGCDEVLPLQRDVVSQ